MAILRNILRPVMEPVLQNTLRRGGGSKNMNVSDCVNNNYTTFANGTPSGFDVTSDGLGDYDAGTADELVLVKDEVYLVEFDYNHTSGGMATARFYLDWSKNSGSASAGYTCIEGVNSVELTCTRSDTCRLVFFHREVAAVYGIRNLSVKKK